MGTIQNADLVKTIDLTVDQYYLDNSQEVYTADLNDAGKFGMVIDIDRPQLVVLEYSRNKTLIYLEPNDTLIINSESANFPYTLSFEGKGGANNRALQEYYRENPTELDLFKMVQYRSGVFWYSNSPRMDEKMLMLNPTEFENSLTMQRERGLALLNFPDQPGRVLSSTFKDFLEAEITYNWAYHMMLFGSVYKNKYQLTDEFFSFLEDLPLQNDQISNYWYRQFLLAYVNYRQQKEDKNTNPYIKQYEIAEASLKDVAASFIKSEIIVKAFRAQNVEEILPYYQQYSKSREYGVFEEKVVENYDKAIRYAVGSLAPEFLLADANGVSHSLSAYKGKVIYLNFWASWCHPCLRKLELIKGIQQEMEEKGVMFVNISVDKDKESWLRLVKEMDLKGVQLIAPKGIDDKVVHLYEVKVLPKYFIIDQSGRFSEKPEKFDPIAIRDVLLDQVKRAEN